MLRRCWALVLGAGLLVWSGTLNNSFHYDDFHSLVENPGIRGLANIPAFFVDPSLFSADATKRMYRLLMAKNRQRLSRSP